MSDNNPYDPSQTDPFTEVLEKLWLLLEEDTYFCITVKNVNRIKLQDKFDKPEKTEFSTADFPQVTIEPGEGAFDVRASTNSTMVQLNYAIEVVTGDLKPTRSLFPLMWRILKILTDTPSNLGLEYVQDISTPNFALARNEELHPGWNVVFNVIVTMSFKTESMEVT